jgi:hypothetical protein
VNLQQRKFGGGLGSAGKILLRNQAAEKPPNSRRENLHFFCCFWDESGVFKNSHMIEHALVIETFKLSCNLM